MDVTCEEHLDGRILLLRLNRPASLNALSRSMVAQMRQALAGLAESNARVLLITGTGRGFCTGADLKERATLPEEGKREHNSEIRALTAELAACPVPTIAVLNGVTMGGGCELALACDLRLAATGVQIGLTEARIGAMPGAGGSQRLPRLIGAARALEMMFGGEPIDAAQALDWGLVNQLHPHEGLEEEALKLATLFASRSRRSSMLLKRAVHDGLQGTLDQGLEIERQAVTEILSSRDYQEGLAAFAARRPPVFE
jgi:enoyl-CoA hydratase/carnithine racemase